MQLLFDFFPVIAFFVAYKLADIYVATGVIIVAVIVQTAVQWLRHRKVSSMALISGLLVLVFGGLTLLVHDEAFIKWKVTIVNWLFCAGFLATMFFGERTLIERMLGESVQLERPLWRKLNLAWAAFFFVLGAINLYVAYSFATEVWVNFKLFGVLGLTLVFALLQGWWLASKLPADKLPAEKSTACRPCWRTRGQGTFPRSRGRRGLRRFAADSTPSTHLSLAWRHDADGHSRAQHYGAHAC
jgi:intracellular septation protein